MGLKRNTIIESMGVYLPPRSFSTQEILTGCKSKINFSLENITGIKTRRMAGEDEFSLDIAKNAISDCLSKSKYTPADIDLLICCNISRYDASGVVSFEPNTSIKLKKHFDFNNAIAFDVSNACAGMFTAIYIIDALLETGVIRRGMVVSGEYITHLTKAAQKQIEGFMDSRLACLTLGDAGSALILENATAKNTGFQSLELQTFGRYSQYCVAKASEHGEFIMFTDSVNLTDAAIKSGARHAMDVLERAGWPAESFQHLVMHQTSRMTLNSARREINHLLKASVCNDGNTINNLEHRGNTASTAHFLAIADQIRNNRINSGDKIVFSISASGLTIGTALYVFDDLPNRLRNGDSKKYINQKDSQTQSAGSGSKSIFRSVRIESVGTMPDDPNAKQNSLQSLKRAASNCLEQSSYDVDDINLLIYSGVYRDEYLLEPAYATLLAGEMHMNATTLQSDGKQTLAFDVFNGSMGFLNACYVAQQMIAGGGCSTAMIVASECENNTAACPTKKMGIRETASAIILDSETLPETGFSRFLFKYYVESLDAYETHYKIDGGDLKPHLHIAKNRDLEALYIDCIVPTVEELLQTEGMDLSCVDIVFSPQISSVFLAELGTRLNLPIEKMVDAVGNGADLFSSSLPYALKYAYENELVKPGDIGLFISVGSGIQVGCAFYHF